MHSSVSFQLAMEEEAWKCVCFMLYVILILSIDVMNVENIVVDVVPRARFFLSFLAPAPNDEFTFVRVSLPDRLPRPQPHNFFVFVIVVTGLAQHHHLRLCYQTRAFPRLLRRHTLSLASSHSKRRKNFFSPRSSRYQLVLR